MGRKSRVEFDFSGLDKFQNNAERLSGLNDIPLVNLFGEELLNKFTNTFNIKSNEDIEKIDKDLLDGFINDNTEYKTYEEFLYEKVNLYLWKELLK